VRCNAAALRAEAKFYNALLFVSMLPLTAINVIFSRDAMIATMVARAASQGRSFPVEKAEVYVACRSTSLSCWSRSC